MSIKDLFQIGSINLNTFSYSFIDTPEKSTNFVNEDLSAISTNDDFAICKICGRKLRGFDSRMLGMGPLCYHKYIKSLNKCHKLI